MYFKQIVLSFSILLAVLQSQLYPETKNPINKTPLTCKNCNVIIIDLDMLRADAIDCEDNFRETPSICTLSSDSLIFKNNISHSDLTLPSFVSANTSLYPASHGTWNALYKTGDNYTYLSEILKVNNYKTAIVGHTINDQVIVKGFDYIINKEFIYNTDFNQIIDGLHNSGNPFFLYIYSDDMHFPYLVRGKTLDNPHKAPKNFPMTREEYENSFSDYLFLNYKNIFTDAAINKNPELFTGKNMDKKKLYDLYWYDNTDKDRITKYLKDSFGPYSKTIFQYIHPDNPDDLQFLKGNYMAILKLLDKKISDITEKLKSSGLIDKTIIVIRSDHGEEFYEHGRYIHANNLYQELLHTPLIMNIPGASHLEINNLTEDVDIMPTLLQILQNPVPSQAQGNNLIPGGFPSTFKGDDYQIAQKGDGDYISTFRKGNYKLIIKENKPFEIYNLVNDPGELSNLIDDQPEIAAELMKNYRDVVDQLPKYNIDISPLPTWIDLKKRQRLKDEGYF